MQQILGKRLPTFTKQEIKLLKGSADFIGLNHYSSMMAAFPTVPPNYSGYWSDQYVTLSDDPSWSKTDMGWNIVPDGAREMLLWLDKRYKHPLIFVTENGMAAYEPDLEHSLQDTSRRDYLEGYIRGFGQALSKGVNLGGYFAWSLMDNFEWEYGFSKRFGLVHVNYTTLVRTPKLSADWYRSTIESNGANISMD
jgi:beta-glucosidase/6-phospho-beta-glucosidase/beta-galactosidase